MKIENISIKQRVKHFFDSHIREGRIKQDGFSLLIVLLFVGVIGMLFSGALWYQQGESMRKKSYAAGWHLVQLSKAARVYVRDRAAPTSPDYDVAFSSASLQTASREISVADLIAANLLPSGFSSVNPLGQNVRIFADNYPPNGSAQVPTAYLITDVATAGTSATVYATARNMASLMQGAREAGMAASAPLIANGVNASDDCGGAPAVMIWDTGCLNATDIDKVTGSSITIAEGQVIVPSWRVINQDFRALMRFPQPENIGANTMLTDLHMGHPEDFMAHPNQDGNENRFNINNVGEMNVVNLIAQDQAGNDDIEVVNASDNLNLGSSGDATNSLQHVLSVAGDLIVNESLEASNTVGSLQRAVYMTGDTNTLNVGGDMTANTLNSTGTITSVQTGNSVMATDNVTAENVRGFAQVNLQNLGDAAPVNLTVTGDGEGGDSGSLIVENITNVDTLEVEGNGPATGAELRVFTQITMNGGTAGIIQVNDTASVGGAQVRAGTLVDNTIRSPIVNFDSGGRVTGNVDFRRSLSVHRCDGECPDNLDNNP